MEFEKLCTFTILLMVLISFDVKAASIHKSSYYSHYSQDDISWTGGKRINDNYQIKWSYDARAKEMTFELTANVLGYLGLGITESGSMKDADIFLAWVKDGKPYVLDCHGPEESNGAPPLIDENNNLQLISGHEANGTTTVRFKRKLRTCDGNERHDIDISSNTARMIYAYSDNDPENDAITEIPYSLQHESSDRGHFDAYLLSPKPPNPAIDEDAIVIDLRLNNVTIPNTDTTYWCDVFKIDRDMDLNGRKHHLVMSNVVIGGHQEANAPYVHHLVLHRCHSFPENWTMSDERPDGGLCYDGGSELVPRCTGDEIISAWAVGGEEFYFPVDVGLPIGEEQEEYYILEMHYDNPTMEAGIKDNSGVRLVMIPTLRKHEASTLAAGVAAFFHAFVPPGVPDFKMEGGCHMNCTQESLPESGINVFAGLLHTHLLGHGVTVRHIRDGVELPYILRDTNYDFNFQDIIPLEQHVKILPGDALLTECIYDSTRKNTVTFGGLSTREEMCISFLYYYPKSEFALCQSAFPSPWEVGPLLGDLTYHDNPDYFPGVLSKPQGPIVEVNGVRSTWVEFLEQYQWNETTIRAVEDIGYTGNRGYSCGIGDDWEGGPIEVSSVYTPPTAETCDNNSSTTVSLPLCHITLWLQALVILFVTRLYQQ